VEIDRGRFLFLVGALAAGACSRQRGVAATGSKKPAPESPQGTAGALSSGADPCAAIDAMVASAHCAEPPLHDPRRYCALYRDTFAPAAAHTATACLAKIAAAQVCDDMCVAYGCGRDALLAHVMQADADVKARCASVEAACAGMGELCEKFLRGMNVAGRSKVAKCFVESCGLGVDYCLGHSGYVSACVEEGGSLP
jgi:hypothetical protein